MALKSNFPSVISVFLVALVRQALNCENGMCKMKSVLLPCGLVLLGCASAKPSTPAATPTVRVTCVWGGAREAIALKSDGTVWTWGHNGCGQLGIGNTIYQSTPVQVLGPGGVGTLNSVIAIAGGEVFNVAVTSDGNVWSWGILPGGQRSSYPVQVEGLSSVIAVASRAYHTLAVKSDGTVWAWGMSTGSPVPVQVRGITNPIMVSAGYCFSLALLQDHTVVAWGDSKQLGLGSKTNLLTAVAVPGLTNVVWISAGWKHALAVKSNGTVWTWGENYWGGAYKGYGKLGNGTRSDQLLPAQVPGLTHVVQASGGDDFSAVLKSDGTVWTFGANGAGQLGNGDPLLAEQLSPVQVVGLKDVIYITARDFHAQAIRSDGTVWSWGSGVQGELGVGGKPLSVQQQFELTGAADRNATPPYCTNSNVPLQVQWPDSKAAAQPALKTLELKLDDRVTMKFVQIPAGRFLMGSPKEEEGRSENEVLHEVTIGKLFWMGVFEVTQEQYRAVMGNNPSQIKGAGQPVEGVNWFDAVAFCRRASAITKRGFRLPTEAEWEYACRAGTQTRYSFGSDEKQLDDYAWYNGNSEATHHPVGQKKPNAWGLYDTHGNVAEWCKDRYLGSLGRNQKPAPPGTLRVDRGGFWDYKASGCRSATRLWSVPGGRSFYIGFRVAVTCSAGE
jgi:formylglycine-generating enzyme required for sulfatase activity